MILTITDASSTALEILLRLNTHYLIFWFILEILLFIFKYFHLPYASNAFGLEIAMIFLLCFNEYLRLFFAVKGNLTLKGNHLIISIVYGVFCIIGFVFFLALQSYIQRAEILLAGIGLLFILLEILLSIITIIRNALTTPMLNSAEKLERVKRAQLAFLASNKTD